MPRGRVVRVWANDGAIPSVFRAFYVGIDHEDTAINAVLAAYPDYEGFTMDAEEGLSSTAVAFLDMREGEIRDRVTESQVNLLKSSATGD